MKFKLGILVGALLVACVFTNPAREKHARKVTETALSSLSEGGTTGTLSRIGGAFAESFSDSVVDYHNYYVFSTTTRPGSNERMSIGILGFVHVDRK